jgi:hypothetical protein
MQRRSGLRDNSSVYYRISPDWTIIRRPDCVFSTIIAGSGAHEEFQINNIKKGLSEMRLTNRIKQAGATGYILLWLLGIPIPILLLIFLLRGCT